MNKKQHTLHRFDTELNSLRAHTQRIGGLAEQQLQQLIGESLQCKVSTNPIPEIYGSIEDLSLQVNQLCHALVARLQPTACDLRLIKGCLKISYELKRAAQVASKVNYLASELKHSNPIYCYRLSFLQTNADLALRMLNAALDSFASYDVSLALSVKPMQEFAEETLRETMKELVDFISTHPSKMSTAFDALTIAKSIEQIGYHAKNIAEYVIYIEEGTPYSVTLNTDPKASALTEEVL